MNNDLTPERPFDNLEATHHVCNELEIKFLELAQLFSRIKIGKLFRIKGYESFRDYLAMEHNMSPSLANKLIKIQSLFIEDMDQDEETLREIGMDRLLMIAPLVAKADWAGKEELLQLAQNSIPVLQQILKERKEAGTEEQAPDLKKVIIDQWKEQMTALFNCSWSEVIFKLALWFSTGDRTDPAILSLLKQEVKAAQIAYEGELNNANR